MSNRIGFNFLNGAVDALSGCCQPFQLPENVKKRLGIITVVSSLSVVAFLTIKSLFNPSEKQFTTSAALPDQQLLPQTELSSGLLDSLRSGLGALADTNIKKDIFEYNSGLLLKNLPKVPENLIVTQSNWLEEFINFVQFNPGQEFSPKFVNETLPLKECIKQLVEFYHIKFATSTLVVPNTIYQPAKITDNLANYNSTAHQDEVMFEIDFDRIATLLNGEPYLCSLKSEEFVKSLTESIADQALPLTKLSLTQAFDVVAWSRAITLASEHALFPSSNVPHKTIPNSVIKTKPGNHCFSNIRIYRTNKIADMGESDKLCGYWMEGIDLSYTNKTGEKITNLLANDVERKEFFIDYGFVSLSEIEDCINTHFGLSLEDIRKDTESELAYHEEIIAEIVIYIMRVRHQEEKPPLFLTETIAWIEQDLKNNSPIQRFLAEKASKQQ